MNINELNDDCLKVIFSLLPFRDKFKCQRVCKLWQSLILQVLYQQTSLTVSDSLKCSDGEQPFACLVRSMARCARLRRLEFVDPSADQKSLLIIANSCEKLSQLILSHYELIDSSIIDVISNGKYAKQLTEIDISHQNVCDDWLTTICKKCTNLRALNVSNNHRITGKPGLQHLGPAIRALDISQCRYIREEGIECLVAGNGRDVRLLNVGTYVSKQTIRCIASRMIALSRLSIDAHYYPECFRCQDLSQLSRLSRLEHLSVHNLVPLLQISFDDTFIQIMKGVPQLKSLSLMTAQISDRSLDCLQQFCPLLQTFHYQYSCYPNVINDCLSSEALLSLCRLNNLTKVNIIGAQLDTPFIKTRRQL